MDQSQIIKTLLDNRGLTSPKQVDEFFHPPHPQDISLSDSGLSASSVKSSIQLIKQHIKQGHKIAVYGDYDVDGICSTAILWETLNTLPSCTAFPHIPHRREEGYGLSTLGIDHCHSQGASLVITVDNGIVAHSQIAYARSLGLDVIVIDHHEAADSLPDANVILHSTASCAAALTWFFCRELSPGSQLISDQLSLVAIAVVCDIIPLIGLNRSLVSHGLPILQSTHRPGLLALFTEAGINPSQLSSYHLGFVIGPRLNAMGRLEHALDSLRLICTHSPLRASQLAQTLGETNRSRQQLTFSSTDHAINFLTRTYASEIPKLLIVSDPQYDQGVIGLIAAKLVEKYHRPAIAISVGDTESKASARSVPGFHITEHLRTASELLINVGGHSMAAGFTVANSNLETLVSTLVSSAETSLDSKLLQKQVRFDLELSLSDLNDNFTPDFYSQLQTFAPFGLGNPQPTFFTRNVTLDSLRRMGSSSQHLRFSVANFSAVAFNHPDPPPSPADITYSLDVNTWQGQTRLQLIVKSFTSAHV